MAKLPFIHLKIPFQKLPQLFKTIWIVLLCLGNIAAAKPGLVNTEKANKLEKGDINKLNRNNLIHSTSTSERIKAGSHELLLLELGEKRVISQLNEKSIWVENGKIVKVNASFNGIEIKALKEGDSLLRIGSKTRLIQVLRPANYILLQKMKEESKKIIGSEILIQKGIPTLSGKLYQIKDWLSFQKGTSPDSSFEIQARMNTEMQTQMQSFISKALEKAHLPPQNLIFSDVVEVRIHKGNESNLRLKRTLENYGFRVIEENISIDVEPLIKVEITVAEVLRERSTQLGLQWPTEFSAQLLGGNWNTDKSLRIIAEFFESQGAGRILASPNILCRTGKEAEFLAGGEFPIKIGGTLRKPGDVIWKKYGVQMKVKPTADRSGRMSIAIDTEVSSIDPSHSIDGIPGILTNKMSSHFDLKKPRIIALSGLLKNTEGELTEGVWGLSRIPILGSLFSSQNYLNNKSELIIFVRPSIVKDHSDNNQGDGEMETPSPIHLDEISGSSK